MIGEGQERRAVMEFIFLEKADSPLPGSFEAAAYTLTTGDRSEFASFMVFKGGRIEEYKFRHVRVMPAYSAPGLTRL